MSPEAKQRFSSQTERIDQKLIGSIRELADLDPRDREALFGHLIDHLIRISSGRSPDRLDVVQEITRLRQLRELGVAENIIWHSLFASDSYFVGAIRQQVQVDELRVDPPGKLWSIFLEATSEQVPEFRKLEPEKRMSTETLGRVLLRNIDPTWGGGCLRFPSRDDWSRYTSHRDVVRGETGLSFGAIRHLELVGVRVVTDHYVAKLGWGDKEMRDLTSQLIQGVTVGR